MYCVIQGSSRPEMVLNSENDDHVNTTVKTNLTEEDVTDAVYDSLNTTKHMKIQKDMKEENYSEVGKVS